jgi:hypothetical protein
VPDSVASHPAVFVTLTAPSFGRVHTHPDNKTGGARKCHGGTVFRRCSHGRPLWCSAVHDADDPVVGEPLCPDCYDYAGHVLFTWWAPELWRRFTIALRRRITSAVRATGGDPGGVRVAFVKVVEFQRRAVPHVHAVIRLDGPPAPDGQPTAPDSAIDAGMLAGLVRQTVGQVAIEVAGPGEADTVVRFGAQTDAQPITGGGAGDDNTSAAVSLGDGGLVDGGRSPRRVAAYLAKYVCKSVAEFGLSPTRMSPLAIDTMPVREHVRTVLTTLRALSALPGYAPMLRWLHTLGYRGHVATKSRRFSTTLAALRARRAAWQRQHASGQEHGWPTTSTDNPSGTDRLDKDASIEWTLGRVGHVCDGDRWLAVSAAVRAREHRIIARAEYADLIAAENDWAAA